MKRNNKKLLTMMLAGALCATTIGGMATLGKVTTNAAEIGEYELTNVFAATDATLGGDEANNTTFTFAKTGSVTLKRNLALKWFEKEGAKYLNFSFAFDGLNFEKVEFIVDSASAWATQYDKATNKIVFEKDADGNLNVKVENGEKDVQTTPVSATAISDMTIALAEGETDGQFKVLLGETEIGTFENVGQNFIKRNTSGEEEAQINPLTIAVTMPETKEEEETEGQAVEEFTIVFNGLNGQSFKALKKDGDKYYVKDTAAPVLVVNEELGGFLLGTKFTLNYEVVDVLETSSSSLSKKVEFYQWNNPETVEEIKYTSTTSTDLFFPVTPNGNGGTIFGEFGKEWVSLKITLGDKVFTADSGENAKVTYDLAWYASEGYVESLKVGEEEKAYIVLDRNEEGATYTHLNANEETGENEEVKDIASECEVFQDKINDLAKELRHGTSVNLSLPSIEWLLSDNNGFRNLSFTIAYKSPSSASEVNSNLSYSSLKIPVKSIGMYEFKIFATDKAGNPMKYYLDNELVEVDATNIWDIKEIPSFTFTIEYKGLKVEEKTIKDKETVGDSYTLSDFTVNGAEDIQKEYFLYKLNESKAEEIGLTESVLTSIKFSDLASEIELEDFDKFAEEYFLVAYKTKLAQKLDIRGYETKMKILDECFVKIEKFDDRIDEEKHPEEWANSDNKYNWQPTSKKFTAVENGTYIMFADYSETMKEGEIATAYKVIVATTEADIYKATSDWLDWVKENVVSVVLFSIAGVMLILIIILLCIKPADETLEEVDEKAKKKAEKQAKKDREDK